MSYFFKEEDYNNGMKYLLFVVLENTNQTSSLIKELSLRGINGTVMASTSLKHVFEDEREDTLQFVSLSHLDQHKLTQNTTIYFILDENNLESVKEIIREKTDHFKNTKGGMFVTPLTDFEGSF